MKADRMNKDRKFRRFFARFVFALLLLAAGFLLLVWKGLEAYQEKTVSEDVIEPWETSQPAFEAYISSCSLDDWADLWYAQNPGSLDLRENVKNTLENLLAVELTYARGIDYSDDQPVYVVLSGETAIAEVQMQTFDGENWQVTDVTLRITGQQEATVTAPSGCRVFCNGVELDESYRQAQEQTFFLEEYADELINPWQTEVWQVTDQLTEPVLEVQPPEGSTLADDGTGNLVLVMEASDLSEKITTKAERVFDAFNKYSLWGAYNTDANVAAVLSLCKTDSQIYNMIYYTQRGTRHVQCYYTYETEKTIEPVMVWADNAVSVDITFHTDAVDYEKNPFEFDGEYRILLIDFGSGYEVCGMVSQS